MRSAVLNLDESMIRQVANAGMGRSDVLKFWFGESDDATPVFIRNAAILSLQQGETFYTHNLGLPELREAIASYSTGLRCPGAAPIEANRIAVTSGGVNALMLAVQALVDAGDEVVAVNFSGFKGVMRAADHQFQQPLEVAVMGRHGLPGVRFDVEGSGYGFRVIKTITAQRAEQPTSCKMVRP